MVSDAFTLGCGYAISMSPISMRMQPMLSRPGGCLVRANDIANTAFAIVIFDDDVTSRGNRFPSMCEL
jgi:hypothetical protein